MESGHPHPNPLPLGEGVSGASAHHSSPFGDSAASSPNTRPPLRLLHLADLHLGTETYGRVDSATGLSTRLADFCRCLDEVVEYALSQDIDLVVFAGDAYRSRDPSPTHQRELAQRIRRLAERGLPVLLVAGNHDTPASPGRASSVDIFETLSVPGVHVARQAQTLLVETRRGPVQVVAVPWPQRSALLSREEHKNRTAEEINALLVERVNDFIAQEEARLDPSLPAVLVAHLSVAGAALGSEVKFRFGQDFVVPLSAVARPAFAYVALGHLHRHQILHHASPPVVYAGSLERVDFGEEHEAKGFVVAELGPGQTRYQFVPVGAREFLTLEVSAGEDPTADVLAAVAGAEIEGKIVRLIVRMEPQYEARLCYPEVRRALRRAGYFAGLVKQVQREARLSTPFPHPEEVSPLEMLEFYLKAREVPAERAGTLLEYAKALLEGAR